MTREGEGPPGANPYRRPGYRQPNPYTGGQPAPPGKRRARVVVAVGSVVAVLVVAVVGAVMLRDGGDSGEARTPAEESTGPSRVPDDPRAGHQEAPDPVVAPDWQVQTVESHRLAFDVPPPDAWELGGENDAVYVGNADEEDGILAAVGAPARYLPGWCPQAEAAGNLSQRALAGTMSGQGFADTAEAAADRARAWATAQFDAEGGELEVSGAEPFENEHGVAGHTVTATVTGVPGAADDPDHPCGTSDGLVITVSYLNADHDVSVWALIADTGVPDALDDATIERIVGSLRPFPEED
ncbi:hypothetical protein [Streptomyces sp. URMC 129]|uniref:hypothetical protein n=1 Tax=Streptomyces sp. URMC 129 TaxID=3423407 RepID=UPI003F1C7B67